MRWTRASGSSVAGGNAIVRGVGARQPGRVALVVVVLICFLTTAVGSSVVTSFSVFHVAVAGDLGWSRAEVTGAFSLAGVVTGFAGPLVGVLVDRLGARAVMTVGGAVGALGLLASAQVREVWQYYVAFGLLVACGTAGFSSVPQNVILAERFSSRRGVVFGLVAAGAGVGTFVLVPTVQLLISTTDWRRAYVILAVVVGITALLPLVTGAGRRSVAANAGPVPQRIVPGGSGTSPPGPSEAEPVGSSRKAVALLVAAVFFSGVQRTVMVVHLVPHLLASGHGMAFAVSTFATSDLVRSFSGVFTGYMSDRVGARIGYVMSCGVGAAAIVLLTLPPPLNGGFVYGLALLYGLGSGGILPASSSVQASVFRTHDRGKLFGVTSMSYGVGSGVGAWTGAFVYDRSGQYELALGFAAFSLLMMAAAVWSATTRRQDRLAVATQ